jgi:hypothetical protein
MYLRLLVVSGILALGACGSTASAPDGGGNGDETCVANATQCDGNTFMSCVSGEWEVSEQCLTTSCDPTYGCVECTPNQNYCDGDSVRTCSEDGKAGLVSEVCEGDSHCSNGACRNLCEDAETARSYLGCEYWAADLDNAMEVAGEADSFLGCTLVALLTPGAVLIEDARVCKNSAGEFAGQCDGDGTCPATFTCQTADVCGLDADGSPFAIVVSNPHDFAVEVTIDNGAGTTSNVSVPANQVSSLYPAELGFADQSLESTSVAAKAYRVRTTAPVAAYQFNPLDNEDVFSNDGSLLIPRHTFDTDYYAMTWETLARRPEREDFTSYTAVVAWKDGTEVTVTPSANIRAGQGQPAMPMGQAQVFTLNAFDVLNLEAIGTGDLTGTRVQVTGGDEATVAVFSGHEAVSILSPGADCCADHIEEMMLPTSTWGTEYAIARSKMRVDESDVLRIMAQTDGTTVDISSGASCPTLAAGEFCEIEISADVEITSSEPVLIGHYLKSVLSQLSGTGSGDPSLAIAVPVEQNRSTYSFLVPAEYDSQYISVVAQMGASVTLDGTDISGQLTSFGSNGRGAGRIQVQPGQHELLCTGGCGLEVYGYSDAVSYYFAGGLDLEQIVVD